MANGQAGLVISTVVAGGHYGESPISSFITQCMNQSTYLSICLPQTQELVLVMKLLALLTFSLKKVYLL